MNLHLKRNCHSLFPEYRRQISFRNVVNLPYTAKNVFRIVRGWYAWRSCVQRRGFERRRVTSVLSSFMTCIILYSYFM